MRLLFALLVALAVAGFVGPFSLNGAHAQEAKKEAKPKKNVRGEVVKVEGNNITLKIKDKQAGTKDIVIATDDKTQVLIEGTPSKLSDLKAGQKVVITPAEGTATKVTVPKAKANKKPAAK